MGAGYYLGVEGRLVNEMRVVEMRLGWDVVVGRADVGLLSHLVSWSQPMTVGWSVPRSLGPKSHLCWCPSKKEHHLPEGGGDQSLPQQVCCRVFMTVGP